MESPRIDDLLIATSQGVLALRRGVLDCIHRASAHNVYVENGKLFVCSSEAECIIIRDLSTGKDRMINTGQYAKGLPRSLARTPGRWYIGISQRATRNESDLAQDGSVLVFDDHFNLIHNIVLKNVGQVLEIRAMTLDRAHNGIPSPKFYSQWGEDRAIASVVFNEGPSFFVDVGAYDGVRDSNTYYFELMGWKGICVEPHPHYFPICAKNRPNSQCLNLAAWEEDGYSTEFYDTMPGNVARIGRLDGLKKTMGMYPGIKVGDPIRVRTKTLDTIFREHWVPRGFGLLSIDVEGTEFNVLRGLTLEKYLPRFVIIEYNHMEGEYSRGPDQPPPQILYDYFRPCEYVGVNNSKSINVIYCRDMEDAKKVALNWKWKGATGFIE